MCTASHDWEGNPKIKVVMVQPCVPATSLEVKCGKYGNRYQERPKQVKNNPKDQRLNRKEAKYAALDHQAWKTTPCSSQICRMLRRCAEEIVLASRSPSSRCQEKEMNFSIFWSFATWNWNGFNWDFILTGAFNRNTFIIMKSANHVAVTGA